MDPIGKSVKQGCVLTPTLFATFFGTMLRDTKDEPNASTSSSKLMEVSSISVTSSPQTTIIDELILEQLFADECALLANTEEALQTVFDHFAKAAPSFGQTISLKKIELLHEDHSHAMHSPPQITINSHLLNLVEQFTYLGSVLSNNATMIKDMTTISPKPAPLVASSTAECGRTTLFSHWTRLEFMW